jgi:hypothetical protein
MERPDLNEIARRPEKYWSADGIPELVMGGLWMVWGSAWLVGERLPRDGANVYWMFVPVLLAGSGVAAVYVIKRLKARLTFPRTGYVEWKEPSGRMRLAAAVLAIVIAAVLAAVVLRGDAGLAGRAPLVLGGVLALGFLGAAARQRAPHLLALAAVAIALGLILDGVAEGWTAVHWLFIGLGAATSLAGWLRLARFRATHPPAAVEGA